MTTNEQEIPIPNNRKSFKEMSTFPILPDHDKFMPGDKVIEVVPSGATTGPIFRVKARFAIDYRDYITLQNTETRLEFTLDYWDIMKRLQLVSHPITNVKKI